MDETAAVEGMQLNGADESDRLGRSRKRVLVVAKGFDVSVPEGCTLRERVLRLESMLRDHFSSCGKVKSVCIPHVRPASTIKTYAYIDIWGKGVEEKALQLNGTEMDGHKLVVTLPLRPMKKTRRRALKNDRYRRSEIMIVRGYDTSLPRKIIMRALGKHFSSCGEVLEVDVVPNQTYPKARNHAYVDIYGEDAKEKALQLSGSDMGGFKLVVEKLGPKPPEAGGRSSSPDRVWAPSYSEFMAWRNTNKRMQLNCKSISEERERRSRKGVLVVAKGFDASVPEGCTPGKHVFHLESMLRDHFSSCGKVKSVCIPHPYYSSTIKRFAYIEILGKNAEERALQLSGALMYGHELVVTLPLRPMTRARRRALKKDRSCRSEMMIVSGYDTSLPRKIIKRALGKHFSSCGEVLEVDVVPNQTYPKARNHAYVDIYGEDAKEKALQLSGSDMGGFKLVEKLGPKPRQLGDEPIDDPIDIFGSPTYSEFMAVRNKRKEEREANKRKEEERNSNKRKENPNPHSNKRKENPNSHSNEKKKKRKTSK